MLRDLTAACLSSCRRHASVPAPNSTPTLSPQSKSGTSLHNSDTASFGPSGNSLPTSSHHGSEDSRCLSSCSCSAVGANSSRAGSRSELLSSHVEGGGASLLNQSDAFAGSQQSPLGSVRLREEEEGMESPGELRRTGEAGRGSQLVEGSCTHSHSQGSHDKGMENIFASSFSFW